MEVRLEALKASDSGGMRFPAEIVDKALPGLKPVRPNKPLNLVVGALGGIVLAFGAAGINVGPANWVRKRLREDAVAV
jgi:uncharacterized protein involved in exopolysaccharide biosynthesis